jgi:hypothetical protein
MDRYSKIPKVINNNSLYENLMKNRFVKHFNQYSTISYTYPTDDQLSTIDFETYIWKAGDRYWKLADRFYNDPTYWWVIGFINKRPIDSDNQVGDVIYIPTDILKVLYLIEG